MDEILCNIIEEAEQTYRQNANGEQDAHTLETFLTLKINEAGYRKDPYPNGKTKGQLIEIIEGLNATIASLRGRLREEHDEAIWHRVKNPSALYERQKEHLLPFASSCPTCKLLAETSTVKP